MVSYFCITNIILNFRFLCLIYNCIAHNSLQFNNFFMLYDIILTMFMTRFHSFKQFSPFNFLYLYMVNSTVQYKPTSRCQHIYKLNCVMFGHYICIFITLSLYSSILYISVVFFLYLIWFSRFRYSMPVFITQLNNISPPPIICSFYLQNRCFSTP